jgi:hypothetical protein
MDDYVTLSGSTGAFQRVEIYNCAAKNYDSCM